MSKLNQPLQSKNIDLKNRIVMPPMATEKSVGNGKVSEEIIEYYDDKTKSGNIGLVITEHSFVSPEGKASAGQMSVAKDENIEGLSKLVNKVHENGSKIFAQISHAGIAAQKAVTGTEPIGPSSVEHPFKRFKNPDLAKEMTSEDINNLIDDFAKAAKRVKKAGFDGVEIHSAHGYLLNQFYSPLTNKRTDEYNGSTLEGRTKILTDILKAVREEVGEDYPIALRLGANDYQEGGTTIEDSIETAKLLEKAGLDLLDISGGMNMFFNPLSSEPGYFKELSAPIKEAVEIPVIVTGGVQTGKEAEELLEENAADLVGIGRALLKDSNWAKKALESLE